MEVVSPYKVYDGTFAIVNELFVPAYVASTKVRVTRNLAHVRVKCTNAGEEAEVPLRLRFSSSPYIGSPFAAVSPVVDVTAGVCMAFSWLTVVTAGSVPT